MAERYGETQTLCSFGMRLIGAAMMLVAVIGTALSLIGGTRTLITFTAPLVLFGTLGWAAFWRPHVEVADSGVTLVNTFRTIEIPWPAITEVRGRYGLQLQTAYGAFTAWGASAPSGGDRRRAADGEAAQAVKRRLEELRAAGWLDDPRLERPEADVRVDEPLVLICLALLVASVVAPLLA